MILEDEGMELWGLFLSSRHIITENETSRPTQVRDVNNIKSRGLVRSRRMKLPIRVMVNNIP